MGCLLNALVDLDNAARVGVRVLGTTSGAARQLQEAVAIVRRQVAPRALADEAATFDPKADFAAIVSAAIAAGLSWPDMVDAFNAIRQRGGR